MKLNNTLKITVLAAALAAAQTMFAQLPIAPEAPVAPPKVEPAPTPKPDEPLSDAQRKEIERLTNERIASIPKPPAIDVDQIKRQAKAEAKAEAEAQVQPLVEKFEAIDKWMKYMGIGMFVLLIAGGIWLFIYLKKKNAPVTPPTNNHGDRTAPPITNPDPTTTTGGGTHIIALLIGLGLALGASNTVHAANTCFNPLTAPSNLAIAMTGTANTINCPSVSGSKVEVVEVVSGVEKTVIFTGTTPASFVFTPTAPMRAVVKVDGRQISPMLISTAKDAGLVNASVDLAASGSKTTTTTVVSGGIDTEARLVLEGLACKDKGAECVAAFRKQAWGKGKGTSHAAGADISYGIIDDSVEATLSDKRLQGVIGAGVSGGIEAYMKAHPQTPGTTTVAYDDKALKAELARLAADQAAINSNMGNLNNGVAQAHDRISNVEGALKQRGTKEMRQAINAGCSFRDISLAVNGCGGGQKPGHPKTEKAKK